MRRKQREAEISEDMQVLKLTNNKEYDATWRRKKQSFNHYLPETFIVRRKNRFCCDSDSQIKHFHSVWLSIRDIKWLPREHISIWTRKNPLFQSCLLAYEQHQHCFSIQSSSDKQCSSAHSYTPTWNNIHSPVQPEKNISPQKPSQDPNRIDSLFTVTFHKWTTLPKQWLNSYLTVG